MVDGKRDGWMRWEMGRGIHDGGSLEHASAGHFGIDVFQEIVNVSHGQPQQIIKRTLAKQQTKAKNDLRHIDY